MDEVIAGRERGPEAKQARERGRERGVVGTRKGGCETGTRNGVWRMDKGLEVVNGLRMQQSWRGFFVKAAGTRRVGGGEGNSAKSEGEAR
eukprot:5346665-Pleurochrysis_carterae.AAC.1